MTAMPPSHPSGEEKPATSRADPESGQVALFPRSVLALTVGSILFRLILFLGRGDYLAFDEGWYLLLGRALFTGEGYSLVGIPHTTLSPLFPILAGATGSILGDWVWGGRVVAAVSSGLLLLPAWVIFRRLAPVRTAFMALVFVAVLPTLAPFGVPFYIGADLWVGAEPLLHLFLFSGVALWLRALESDRLTSWALAGAAFGLGFLARPEAIITWGLLGLWALALAGSRRSPRLLGGAFLMGLGFFVVALPYWAHLHEVTGRWTLTGRGISATANAVNMVTGASRGGASSTIEDMLWADDDSYVERLYGLDDTGLRLRSDYWGVYPEEAGTDGSDGGPSASAAEGGPPPEALPSPPYPREEQPASQPSPSFARLFVRTMTTVLPPVLWPFVLLGLLAPRAERAPAREIPVVLSLLGTSLAIALLVAVDPRTQLFLAPLLAFFVARGFHLLDDVLGPRLRRFLARPGFLKGVLAGLTVIGLLGVSVTRLYLGLAFGSPHHLVAMQNRMVAEELNTRFDVPAGPVASWHPGMAVYADRDWRVLPFADLPRVIRYSQAAGARVMVLSAYYPPFQGEEILGSRYVVVPVPDGPPVEHGKWVLTPVVGDSLRALGRLEPGM